MSSVFIHNSNNILGKSLVDFFLEDGADGKNIVSIFGNQNISRIQIADKMTNVKFFNTADDLKPHLQDENMFIFNTKLFNEIDLLDENYARTLTENLNEIFNFTNNICKFLIANGKKGKFVFITVNPSLGNIFDFPTAPIYDEAIHSFVKSLAKEMTPFKIIVNAICIEPIFEMLDKEQLRTYRRKMKVYAIQKTPTKIAEFLDAVQYILSNDSHLFSGKIYCLGEGM